MGKLTVMTPDHQLGGTKAPARVEREQLMNALDAISDANRLLFEALTESARAEAGAFPLPSVVRSHWARSTSEQHQAAAECGVLLIDTRLSKMDGTAVEADPCRSIVPFAVASTWLTAERAASLAHATLMVAWHVAQASTALARILLGLSLQCAEAFVRFGVRDVARLAQTLAPSIGPRWPDRMEVWANLLEPTVTRPKVAIHSARLRCLQWSARDALARENSSAIGV